MPHIEALGRAAQSSHDRVGQAQQAWAARPLRERLGIVRKARYALARRASELIDAIPASLARTRADSYVAEVLPLLAAARFIEKEATAILRPRRLGLKGRPFWLAGVHTTVERVPFGVVLIIAPANYPLFLAGVQVLQALAAGNAAVWKPGRGGEPVAQVFASTLAQAGLPAGLLAITADSAAEGERAIRARPAKIVFTGSSQAGRQVLRAAAELAIPVVAELSGADAVVVLPSADSELVVDALCFGMRLNGSATCMAPRRLFLVGDSDQTLLASLRERFAAIPGIPVADPARRELVNLIEAAIADGALLYGNLKAPLLRPLLVEGVTPRMSLPNTDLFVPVLSVLQASNADAVVAMDDLCPFGLTVSIFGDEPAARALGNRLTTGTVLVNDLIVPTADPRVPFGGRRGSGFGVTRGREGLLEMTAPKTVAVRRGRPLRQYQPTGEHHEALFAGLVAAAHGGSLRQRLAGLRDLAAAAGTLNRSQKRSQEHPEEKFRRMQ